MASIQVGKIKLLYDESVADIKRIAEIINLNQYLFIDYNGKVISLVPPTSSENDNVIYITDFDQFFDNLLKAFLQDANFTSALADPAVLPAVYIKLLVRKIAQDKDVFVMADNDISPDMLWFFAACKYFDTKTNFSELSSFLKYRNNSECIFEWLKETQRFNAYNYLLEAISNYLKEYDLSFFDNIGDIIFKMSEESMMLSYSLRKESDYDLPPMSPEAFEQTFFCFLDSIRAPEQWKNMYIKLKSEKGILFEESTDGLDHSEVFKAEDGTKKIRVTTDETIKRFASFVHEFMHYVALRGDTIPFSVFEFPPIYYERMAANYLISIGYDENIIKQVMRDRNQNNFDIYASIFNLLLDISMYNKNGSITKEQKIAPFKKSMEIIYETRKQLAKIAEEAGEEPIEVGSLDVLNANLEEAADKDCDASIEQFIKTGPFLLNGYQYLIDSYLADSVLEKQADETLLDKMVFVTEHLADFTIEKLMNYLGIDNAFAPRVGNRK